MIRESEKADLTMLPNQPNLIESPAAEADLNAPANQAAVSAQSISFFDQRTLVSSAVSAAKRPVDRTAACWGAKAEALAAKVNKRALESFMVNGD